MHGGRTNACLNANLLRRPSAKIARVGRTSSEIARVGRANVLWNSNLLCPEDPSLCRTHECVATCEFEGQTAKTSVKLHLKHLKSRCDPVARNERQTAKTNVKSAFLPLREMFLPCCCLGNFSHQGHSVGLQCAVLLDVFFFACNHLQVRHHICRAGCDRGSRERTVDDSSWPCHAIWRFQYLSHFHPSKVGDLRNSAEHWSGSGKVCEVVKEEGTKWSQVPLSEWFERFGTGMLVPLRCRCGVAAQCCSKVLLCALERESWCRWRVPLQGAACGRCCQRRARAWSGHAGAAAVFRCQLRLQGAARRCWYHSGARALEQACWYHCRVPLQGMLGIAQGRTINSKRSSWFKVPWPWYLLSLPLLIYSLLLLFFSIKTLSTWQGHWQNWLGPLWKTKTGD